jgi:hypothetical protein
MDLTFPVPWDAQCEGIMTCATSCDTREPFKLVMMLSLPIYQYPTIILSICMILKSIWDTTRCQVFPILESPAPLAFWTNVVLPTSMLLSEAAGFLSATPVSKALWSMMEESPLMFPTL